MSSFTFLVSWLVDWAQRGMLVGTSIDMACPASWPQGSQTSSKMTQGYQKECSKRLDSSCKVFYDLALEIPGFHFCHILLVRQVTEASSDSKGMELDATS